MNDMFIKVYARKKPHVKRLLNGVEKKGSGEKEEARGPLIRR